MCNGKKRNYFYIDESGSIGNDSPIFIHGCVGTDSPDTISNGLKRLKQEMLSSIYYEALRDRIMKDGFHAVANHPDMRADVCKLLPLLEYRAYFALVDKNSAYFKSLRTRYQEYEIFQFFVNKLIMDRLRGNVDATNIFYFEYIHVAKRSLDAILSDIFDRISNSYDCEYKIVAKEDEENMAVADYVNYIVYQVLSKLEPSERMQQNFNLIAPKIGLINILHRNVYLARKKRPDRRINLTNLKREFSGLSE